MSKARETHREIQTRKTRLFSSIENDDNNDNTKKQRNAYLQTNNPLVTITFQDNDSNPVKLQVLNNFLCGKLRSSTGVFEHLYICNCRTLNQWQIVYHPNSYKVKELTHVTTIAKGTVVGEGIRIMCCNPKTRELFYTSNGKLTSFNLHPRLYEETDQRDFVWGMVITENEIITGRQSDEEVILERQSGEKVSLGNYKGFYKLILNKVTQEFAIYNIHTKVIEIWCLKTITEKQRFMITRSQNICFLGRSKYIAVGGSLGSVMIWNKESQENTPVTSYKIPDEFVVFAIYSEKMNRLILGTNTGTLQVLRFNPDNCTLVKEKDLKILFGSLVIHLQLLDGTRETQLLVVARCGMFIVDLESMEIVWQNQENVFDGTIFQSIVM